MSACSVSSAQDTSSVAQLGPDHLKQGMFTLCTSCSTSGSPFNQNITGLLNEMRCSLVRSG